MDRDKVLKGLDVCLKNIDQPGCPNDCPYLSDCSKYENRVVFQPLMRDALALLKEQPEIVRCKDCRKNMMCEITLNKPKNWFCADGERREYVKPVTGSATDWDGVECE